MAENKNRVLFIPGVIAPTFRGSWSYFHNVEEIAKKSNLEAIVCPLPTWGSIETRAPILREFIQNHLKNQNFHVVAHSKGGVDFRYLLQEQPELVSQIKSLTSISVPYKGSPIADFFSTLLGPLKKIGLFPHFFATLQELKSSSMKGIWTKDFEFPIFYIGARINSLNKTYPLFWLTHYLINKKEGDNDGLVSLDSCKHGKRISIEHADHIALIGHFFIKYRAFNYDKFLKKIFENIKSI